MTQYTLDNPNLAETYDRLSDFQFKRGSQLVALLGIRPDDLVLDIGSGTGRLGLHVLENLLGENGKLVGFDPLPDRVALANAKNPYSNGSFQVAKAEHLPGIGDSSADIAYLSSVFHWIEDKPQALREILRVLKPGGKVGITTGAREFQKTNYVRKVVDGVLSRPPYLGAVRLEDNIQNRNAVTSTQLIDLFLAADLEVVNLEVKPLANNLPDGASVLDFSESSSFGNSLAHVPESLREQARADIAQEFDRLADGHPIPTGNFGLTAVARKPVR